MADAREISWRMRKEAGIQLWVWVRWRYLRVLPAGGELKTAWLDLLGWLAGYCHHCPGETGGGYAHWRCERRKGHPGYHRGINYLWPDDGHVFYSPPGPLSTPEPRSTYALRVRNPSWRYRIRRMRQWNS